MLGNLLILMAILYVSVYCGMVLVRNDGIANDIVFINKNEYLGALGMSIYCFEGIGIVMPVMHSSESPESFKASLICAIATLTIIYIFFGNHKFELRKLIRNQIHEESHLTYED